MSKQQNSKPEQPKLPPTLDFGGALGGSYGFVPAHLQEEAERRRQRAREAQPNLPAPSNPFGQKPPDCPSLF